MLEYELFRSARKTVGITVKDGCVVVKAPRYVSASDIDLFVNANREWIEKKLSADEQKRKRFADYLNCVKFLFRGRSIESRAENVKRIALTSEALCVPKGSDFGAIRQKIIREYKRVASEFLSSRLDVLSAYTGMTFDRFMLTNARTKWGSCSTAKLIRLNWRLVMLPDGLSDYVIIHELCHTKYMNHSAKFWNCVREYISDYKKRKQLLKEYSVIMDVLR